VEQDILRAMAGRMEVYLKDLGDLVGLDTPSDEPLMTARLLDLVAPRLAGLGAQIARPAQDILRADFAESPAEPMLLLVHADTVFPSGEALRRPLRTEEGRAYGPGVADMKGGIALLLSLLEVLREQGARPGALRILVTGDEETGAARSAGEIERAAQGVRAALVLEPGRENGAIVSARKAVGTFQLEAAGIEAHAGVEPWRGASAVHEISRRVAAIAELSNRLPDVHFNVGRIEGGSRPNVVAGAARCAIDVRVPTVRDMETARRLLSEAALAGGDPRVELSLTGGFASPPLERTPASETLLRHARAAALAAGFELEDVATGGGSDGNRVAALGVPVLDGLGPVGGRAHSEEEYLVLASVPERAALLGGLMLRLGRTG